MCERIIFGGDKRQDFLANELKKQGISVSFADKQEVFLKKNAVILAPIPFTKDKRTCYFSPDSTSSRHWFSGCPSQEKFGLPIDEFLSFLSPGQILFGGNLPGNVREFCSDNQISWVDYMEIEEICMKNSIATAEGAVCEGIKNSPVNLQSSPCLLGGYGRCGRILAQKLRGMGSILTVLEQDERKLLQAEADGFFALHINDLLSLSHPQTFLFLFNTIPHRVFGREFLEKTSEAITIIDLASAPGGVDLNYCKTTGKTALLCPGLPGKYAPLTSAEILCRALLSHPEFIKRLS